MRLQQPAIQGRIWPQLWNKQLGLKLVASKAKLDVIVIDQAEKVPTEN